MFEVPAAAVGLRRVAVAARHGPSATRRRPEVGPAAAAGVEKARRRRRVAARVDHDVHDGSRHFRVQCARKLEGSRGPVRVAIRRAGAPHAFPEHSETQRFALQHAEANAAIRSRRGAQESGRAVDGLGEGERQAGKTPVIVAPRAGSEGRPERHVLDSPGSLARDARLSNRLDEARCRRRLADLRKAAPDRAAAVESRLRARAAAPEQPVERRRASAYGQLQPKQLLVALALL